jgi:hypothetical protein
MTLTGGLHDYMSDQQAWHYLIRRPENENLSILAISGKRIPRSFHFLMCWKSYLSYSNFLSLPNPLFPTCHELLYGSISCIIGKEIYTVSAISN